MTDHANELRRYARKIAHPAGDVPSVMLAAADEIERLAARLEAAEKERDELRAKVAGLVPIGLLYVGGYYGEELQDWEFEADQQACDRLNEAHFQREATLNLYALPGVKGEEK